MFKNIEGITLDRILSDDTPGAPSLKTFLRFCARGEQSIIVCGTSTHEVISLQKALLTEAHDKHLLTGFLRNDEDSWLFVRATSVMPVAPVMGCLVESSAVALQQMWGAMTRRGESMKDAFWLTANAVDITITLAEVEGEVVISEVAEINGTEIGFNPIVIFKYEHGKFVSKNPPTVVLANSVTGALRKSKELFKAFLDQQWQGRLTEVDVRNRASTASRYT